MASGERIQRVAERIAELTRNGKRLVVVVSAMGDTTDDLISLMRKISHDPDPRELDQLMATGEMISCSLTVGALQKLGVMAKSYNAFNLGIRTTEKHGSAEITNFENITGMAKFIEPGCVAVVAGFQGMTKTGDLTTLGRGGSDITAVALARELGQKVCEKYTDEDGIYSADPRLISSAKKIWHIDYEEMDMLSRYGNGILHPRSIAYAKDASIRIHVRSSFTREEGSIVGPDGDPSIPVKSISCDKKQAVVTIEGIKKNKKAESDFEKYEPGFLIMAKEWRTLDDITGSMRIGFKISDCFEALPFLWSHAAGLDAEEMIFNAHLWVISIVGSGLRRNPTIADIFLHALEKEQINAVLIEQDEIRLTLAITAEQSGTALNILHSELTNLR